MAPLGVVVVGQTPPPFGGQAMVIKLLMEGSYRDVRLSLVRMGFSREMPEIGRLSIRKLLMLPALIARIAHARLKTGAQVLFYPPSSLERIGLYRDIVVLLATRWMFRRTVYHFLSGGISEHYPKLSAPVRLLVRAAMFEPDVAVRTSEHAPPDPAAVRAEREVLLHNPVQDIPESVMRNPPPKDDPPMVLYAAVLRESKGVLDLLEACARARDKGARLKVMVLGHSASEEMDRRIARLIAERQLADIVHLAGVITGDALHEMYARASVFCFPSYFETEALPLVVVQALQHSLPVVATRWRGIPSLVVDGDNGYLVEPRNVENLACRLAELLDDPALRARMGASGHRRHVERFTLSAFHAGMQRVFDELR